MTEKGPFREIIQFGIHDDQVRQGVLPQLIECAHTVSHGSDIATPAQKPVDLESDGSVPVHDKYVSFHVLLFVVRPCFSGGSY
jgi:hypothetical protein